jgi:hypothetical protein
MSKAVKTIVSVAAAVAIPFAAPAIASSIGLSGAIAGAVGSATAGSVIGGAVTGAALGAAKGAVLGEDVGRGALMGGLGGGIGGYTSAPATASAIPAEAITAANATADPIAALNASQGWTTVDPAYLAEISASGMGGAAAMTAQQTPQAGLNTEGLAGGMQQPATTQVPGELGTGLQMPGAQSAVGLQMPAQAATTTGATTGSFLDALKQVPSQIAAKFSDPKAMADLTLRAAGQLAGSALAGSGLSEQEQALLNAQTEELRKLQTENAGLFAQRLQQAQNLIGESRYFDPEYFGLQSARRAQVTGARAKRAGLRGLTGETREAQARRYDIETGRSTGTAYDVGYGTGLQGRLQTMQTGMSMMPTGYPSTAADYGRLQDTYTGAAKRAAEKAKAYGTFFGSLTGRQEEPKQKQQSDTDTETV